MKNFYLSNFSFLKSAFSIFENNNLIFNNKTFKNAYSIGNTVRIFSCGAWTQIRLHLLAQEICFANIHSAFIQNKAMFHRFHAVRISMFQLRYT